jgi:hypothetical protein
MWQRDPFPRENKYIISDEYFNGFPSLLSTSASQKIYILTGVSITLKKK